MKLHCLPLLLLVALAIPPGLHAEDPQAPREVTKLDGSKLFGVVEVTDDYTVRIQSDSGIVNLPIALLSKKDFQKYSGDSDRSKDGRLWSERQTALEEEQKKEGNQKGKNGGIEIQLTEIVPLQPLIAAWESATGAKSKKAEPAAEAESSPAPASDETHSPPSRNLFSGPGSFNVPTVPFASGAADLVTSPAASATESLGGVVPTGLTPP